MVRSMMPLHDSNRNVELPGSLETGLANNAISEQEALEMWEWQASLTGQGPWEVPDRLKAAFSRLWFLLHWEVKHPLQ